MEETVEGRQGHYSCVVDSLSAPAAVGALREDPVLLGDAKR